ncbi:hypothetical protein [Aureimonas leprariae]|uniref:Uncharacterized protein n=1 Tax=Plantimonas leprariae TaxID=2615207 RepID=A0A7V7PN37_9HYPH|nr:hypothetical protein [Aureimonas leprariae]KAB0679031.1 hypothetical protein F6X38_14125 [Aureimonas leprariae]
MFPATATDEVLPAAAPRDDAAGRPRGAVDGFDPLTGIEGWALAAGAPADTVRIELTVGADAFAFAQTGLPRPDLGPGSLAGFRFAPEVFARLAKLAPHRGTLAVGVRVADADRTLPADCALPATVAECVAAWRSAVLGAKRFDEASPAKGDRLLARLSAFRLEAQSLAGKPLRPFSDNEVGRIDALHLASEGQLWFVGSMKRGMEPEFPAVVADRRKIPAGVAILHYERQDLPLSEVGVIGVMDTSWTPPPAADDGFVYVGRNGQFHLRYGAHTKLLRTEAFLAAYGQVQAVAGGRNADAIAAVLGSAANWLPGAAAAAGILAEGSVDRLLAVPGFGCIAEGWAVSPARRVETFHLKIGDCVMVADDAATEFRARPDLQSAFGGGASVTQRAGFVAVLRGALPASTGGAPLLRIVHADGSMAVSRVEPKALRLLDFVADGEELLRLYPSLRHEPFYPALLDAVRRMLDARAAEPLAFGAPMAARRLIVIRLPAERSNLRLVFDRLARHLPDLDASIGVALVADQGAGRSEALLQFHELKARVATPLSLFALPHEFDAVDELPFILTRLGAERFVHVGRGVVLTAEGWREAATSLFRRGHFVDRFEIVDENGLPDRVDGALSAACFGWSVPALLGWSLDAPRFLRGVFGGNALPETPGFDRVLPACAARIERAKPSRLADMIDADLALAGSRKDAA